MEAGAQSQQAKSAKERALLKTLRRDAPTPLPFDHNYRPARPPRPNRPGRLSRPPALKAQELWGCPFCGATQTEATFAAHIQQCADVPHTHAVSRDMAFSSVRPCAPVTTRVSDTPGDINPPPRPRTYFLPIVGRSNSPLRTPSGGKNVARIRSMFGDAYDPDTATSPPSPSAVRRSQLAKTPERERRGADSGVCVLCRNAAISLDRHFAICAPKSAQSISPPAGIAAARVTGPLIATVPHSSANAPKEPPINIPELNAPEGKKGSRIASMGMSPVNPQLQFKEEKAGVAASSCPTLVLQPKVKPRRKLSSSIRKTEMSPLARRGSETSMTSLFAHESGDVQDMAIKLAEEYDHLKFVPATALIADGTAVAIYCFQVGAFVRMGKDIKMYADTPMTGEAMPDTHFVFKGTTDGKCNFKSELWGKVAWKKEDQLFLHNGVLHTRGKKGVVRVLVVDEHGVASFAPADADGVRSVPVHVFPLQFGAAATS